MASAINSKLAVKLRSLEAECLRVADLRLSASELDTLKIYNDRLEQLNKSHSQSWFGDHATTYYKDFATPPGGRTFNVEWGFISGYSGSFNPGWHTYSRDEVRAFAFTEIGEDIFYATNRLADDVQEQFTSLHGQVLDALELLSPAVVSRAVERYTAKITADLKPYSIVDYINGRLKSTPNITRDSEEASKGQIAPVHVQYLAPIQSYDVNRRRLRELAATLRNAIEATELTVETDTRHASSKSIFIGHGRSKEWLALKDFITVRLHLEFEEFNRVSAAGIGTQERLGEMLAKCCFAFLVFTAEDAHQDQGLHARENVIHEAGLFQGKLGFRRAIILLEDGCREFSNIVGLGQIRFNKDDISTCFEQVRQVLEREGVIST